jgi:hypothetical protein
MDKALVVDLITMSLVTDCFLLVLAITPILGCVGKGIPHLNLVPLQDYTFFSWSGSITFVLNPLPPRITGLPPVAMFIQGLITTFLAFSNRTCEEKKRRSYFNS